MRYDSHDSVCNSFLQARPFMQDVIPNYTTFYMYIYIYIYIHYNYVLYFGKHFEIFENIL